MDIAVSTRVIKRNNIGQFTAACMDAAQDTIEDIVEEGASLSRQMAPVGSKPDPRTTKLKNSIRSRVISRTSGYWEATARHALPQETGAGPHPIAGNPNLAFFWEKEGRWYIPASILHRMPGMISVVNHPGHGPQPYLQPAYDLVWRRALVIADKNYPG